MNALDCHVLFSGVLKYILAFWQTLSAQDCHALFECIGEFAEIWQTLGALDRLFSNVLESLDMLPEVSGQIELMPEKACKSAAA